METDNGYKRHRNFSKATSAVTVTNAYTAAYGMFYFGQLKSLSVSGDVLELICSSKTPVAGGMMGTHCLQSPRSHGGSAEDTGVGLQSCHMQDGPWTRELQRS